MMNLIKKLKGIIIFVSVEYFFYLKSKPKNLEMFFMIWGFISLILLLYNVFNVNTDGSYSNLGSTSQGNYANMQGILIEREYESNESKKRSGGGFWDSTNILYLCVFIANFIGYILIMPK